MEEQWDSDEDTLGTAEDRAKAREMIELVGTVGEQVRALEKVRKPVADRLKQWLGLNHDSLDPDGKRMVMRAPGFSAYLQERSGKASLAFTQIAATSDGHSAIVELAIIGALSFDEKAFTEWAEKNGGDSNPLVDTVARNMRRGSPTYALIVEKEGDH